MTAAEASRSRGQLFVIAAPSGAGKTSLVKALLARKPELHVSISHTTRKMRPNEAEGREYYFIPVEEFREKVKRKEFLEHAQVFDNYYGTARAPVNEQLAEGRNVILEIDWQGAEQVRAAMPEARTIFILPPSRRALEERRRTRNTDSNELSVGRIRDAVSDMSHWKDFDYVVVNDDFDRATADLATIVEGNGTSLIAARPALTPLLQDLLS